MTTGCGLGFVLADPVHLLSGTGAAVLPALAAVATIGAGLGARREYIAYEKAAVGVRSERRVVSRLARLGAHAVVNGAMLGAPGDADHVVIGPALVVVETKTGKGRARYGNGELHVGRRRVPGDPVAQVRRQASALARIAGRDPLAVVCVVDMTNGPLRVGDVAICALDDLEHVVAGAPRVLAAEQAEALAARLEGLVGIEHQEPGRVADLHSPARHGTQGRRPLHPQR